MPDLRYGTFTFLRQVAMIYRIGGTRRTAVAISASGRGGRTPSSSPGSALRAGAVRGGVLTAVLALALFAPAPAASQVEVEADPFAYALNGFSLHLATRMSDLRFSAGTFGIDVPRFFHGQDDWSAKMRGAGIKVDHVGSSTDGFFVGADAGYMRMSYTLDEAAATAKRGELNVGVRGGYRLPVGGAGFYLAPWVGIGYSFGDDVRIGEQTFQHTPIVVFPTIHVGWRF